MSISQYKNNIDILITNTQVKGSRLSQSHIDLLESKFVSTNFGVTKRNPYLTGNHDITNLKDNSDVVELHLYTMDGIYINGNHFVNTWDIIDTVNENSIYFDYLNEQKIKLDVYSDITSFGYKNLPMKMVYNFHRDIVGSYLSEKKLFIKEISPNRTEIRVGIETDDPGLLIQYDKVFLNWFVRNKPEYFPNILLNFGRNNLYVVANIKEDLNNECLIKLYDPLISEIEVGSKFHVTSEIIRPHIETIFLYDDPQQTQYNKLSDANFNIENDYTIKSDTPYVSWDDILSTNISSTQKVIDSMGSDLNDIRRNIDYSNPENYIHYSNLTLRVNNFFGKIKKIESYNLLIDNLSSVSGDIGQSKINYVNKRNDIISKFDDFERWLYFSPPLAETTVDGYPLQGIIGKINPYPKPDTTVEYPEQSNWDVWADLWNQSVVYWGKDGGSETFEQQYPYVIATHTDLYTIGWYRETIRVAEEYDKNNIYALRQTLPEYILTNTLNSDFVKFIDMISHHFDVLWVYVTYLSKVNKREHNPHNSFPDKLLYDVTKDFGWKLSNGSANSDLGLYELGISTSDTKKQPKRSGLTTKSDKERMYDIWRRILNDLPYIYKSKGTIKSIEALINDYGIPSTILKPMEYSGNTKNVARKSMINYDKYTYDVKFGSGKYITIPWDEFEVGS